MNMTLRGGIPALALFLLIGLVGCGGSGTDSVPVAQSAIAGPGDPLASGLPTPPPCTLDRYVLLFYSPTGPFTGEPRVMRAALDCVGKGVAGAAIDWTVTAGDGSIDGSRTVRTLTDSSGVAEVTWSIGPTEATQALEAAYNGGLKPLRGAVTYTRIDVGPNRCEATGGTDLGTGRTVSASETWTKAQSPYFTQCTTTAACAGEVLVTNGAVLTIEPGVAACVNRISVEEAGRVVAAGTAAEPIHFGVRNRADHWSGLELRTPSTNPAPTETSVIKHAVIENALDIKVPGHPIVIEDTVMRRVAPASRTDRCTNFSIRQHAIANVEPSRVLRTVVDGLGGSGGWEWDDPLSGGPRRQDCYRRASDPWPASRQLARRRRARLRSRLPSDGQPGAPDAMRDLGQRICGPYGRRCRECREYPCRPQCVQRFRKHRSWRVPVDTVRSTTRRARQLVGRSGRSGGTTGRWRRRQRRYK